MRILVAGSAAHPDWTMVAAGEAVAAVAVAVAAAVVAETISGVVPAAAGAEAGEAMAEAVAEAISISSGTRGEISRSIKVRTGAVAELGIQRGAVFA